MKLLLPTPNHNNNYVGFALKHLQHWRFVLRQSFGKGWSYKPSKRTNQNTQFQENKETKRHMQLTCNTIQHLKQTTPIETRFFLFHSKSLPAKEALAVDSSLPDLKRTRLAAGKTTSCKPMGFLQNVLYPWLRVVLDQTHGFLLKKHFWLEPKSYLKKNI